MSTPRVSVVIPTYNRSAMLCKAVESVLAQTYQDYEIIIVDDGSTDDTKEVIQNRYGDNSQIHYLYKTNGGLADARNHGIHHARGEILAFLDDDDLYFPTYLGVLIKKLEEFPDSGLCFSDSLIEGGSCNNQTFFSVNKFNGKATVAKMLKGPFSTAAVVVRKSCFRQAGLFDVTLSNQEDWDMWIRIFEIGRASCRERV